MINQKFIAKVERSGRYDQALRNKYRGKIVWTSNDDGGSESVDPSIIVKFPDGSMAYVGNPQAECFETFAYPVEYVG